MASRRQLKKTLKQITNSLFADCLVLQLVDDTDKSVLEALMQDIVRLNQEYVARISHTEPGSVRLYYRKLRSEFLDKANAIGQALLKA